MYEPNGRSVWNRDLRGLVACVAAFSAAGGWTGEAAAAAWQVQPSVGLEERYDDNPRLAPEGGDDTFATTLSAALELHRLTEVREIRGLLRLDAIDYSSNEPGLEDKNNQIARLTYQGKGERSRAALDTSYRRDTLIRTADVTFDPGDVQVEPDEDVDDVLVRASIRRERLVVRPSWERDLSERARLRAEYRYNDVTHDEPASLEDVIRDYTEHRLSLTSFYNVTERGAVSASLEGSTYEPEDGGQYDTLSLRLGYGHRFSELTSASFDIGASRVEFDTGTEDGEENGFLYGISAQKRTGLTRYSGRVSRRLYPSGSGHVVETDELVFNMNRRLTELSTLKLRSRVYEYESLARDVIDPNRRYLILDAGVVRRLSQWWTLEGSYRYRRQKRETDADSAESNAVFISIKYTKPTAVADLFF